MESWSRVVSETISKIGNTLKKEKKSEQNLSKTRANIIIFIIACPQGIHFAILGPKYANINQHKPK